jgi:hypothetical protein
LRAKAIFLLFLFAFLAFSAAPVDGIRFRLLYGSRLFTENVLLTSGPEAESAETVGDQSILAESLAALESTRLGKRLVRHMRDEGISVRFGSARTPGAAAVFVPEAARNGSGEIIVEPRYSSQPPRVLAAIIAHEIAHAERYENGMELSPKHELLAYRAQARVWQELRAGFSAKIGPLALEAFESSPENDYAVRISRVEERRAFKSIQLDYRRMGIEPN